MNLDNVIAKRSKKTIYRDGDSVIKVFDEEYLKSDVLKEALNQARIEETNLNVPKILQVTHIENKWAIVSEFIEGKTLAMLMEENPDKEDEYLDLFLNIQKEILASKSPLLTKLKDKMKTKINNSNYDSAIKYELNARIESTPNHSCVCHGDFNPSNIIIREDGRAYVLDWSHVTQGNASADVARTYLLFKIAKKDKLAEKYIDKYCLSTNTSKSYVQKWIPVVAATQMLKNVPGEEEILHKWIDVLGYSM